MNRITSLVLLVVITCFQWACKSKDDAMLNLPEYNGPIMELQDVLTYYSDSAKVKLKLEAPKEYQYENGDREFPDGLHLEFYDTNGKVTSTLKANYCYFTKKDNLWKATGNVIIKGYTNNEQLDTEELFWNQREEKIFTDKFVRIEKNGEIHMGEGLTAKQDFSEYKILHSRGTITLDDGS